jgi:hypothetical protein
VRQLVLKPVEWSTAATAQCANWSGTSCVAGWAAADETRSAPDLQERRHIRLREALGEQQLDFGLGLMFGRGWRSRRSGLS